MNNNAFDFIEELELRIRSLFPKMVHFSGNILSKNMIIGEAPGKEEEKEGRPFVGKSGSLLRSTIKKFIDAYEEKTLITNACWIRPCDDNGNNRTPTKSEIALFWGLLSELILITKPTTILFVGKISESISKRIEQIHSKCKFFYCYHPSYVLRKRDNKIIKEFEDSVSNFARNLDIE